ncbi:MAG: hypothetical protein HYZ53_23165 [Planctomycetes bacterium]|nr:hypothetical protein [Planctomycetota bacterium]
MLVNLYRLGRVIAEGQSAARLLLDGLDELYSREVALKFSPDGKRFLKCEGRELSPSQQAAFPYKKGPDAGVDPLPVTRYSGTGAKVVRRMSRGLIAARAWAVKEPACQKLCSLLADLSDTLMRNGVATEIATQLEETVKTVGASTARRVVVSIDAGGPLHARGEWDQRLLAAMRQQYGSRDEVSCTLAPGRCALCGELRPEVYGNFNEIKAYNLDKPGTIAGGAQVAAAARNFPVCVECAAYVTCAFRRAEKSLSFVMGGGAGGIGVPYLLLPLAENDTSRKELFTVLAGTKRQRTRALGEDSLKSFTREESEVLDFVADKFGASDNVGLQMIFFQKNKAEWRIQAEASQVLPSRLKVILAAKRDAEKLAFLRTEDRVNVPLLANFAGGAAPLKFRKGFPPEPFKPAQRVVLSWLTSVFGDGRLEYSSVLRLIVDRVLAEYRAGKKGWPRPLVRRAFLVLEFFRLLKVLPLDGVSAMPESPPGDGPVDRFFAAHPAFFNRPEKRVAFLTGCVAADVAYVQYKNLRSQPFLRKVHGMRLDAGRLKRILSDAKLKLLQYKAAGLSADTMTHLSEGWLATGDRWQISDDETTFYFVLGLNLNWHVKGQKPPEDAKVEEDEDSEEGDQE